MQSWIDAGQRGGQAIQSLLPSRERIDYLLNTPTDFISGVDMNDGRRGLGFDRQRGANPAGAPRNPFAGEGQGFMDYVRASPLAGLANIFPPNLLRDSFNNMLAGASSVFRQGPEGGVSGAAPAPAVPGMSGTQGTQGTPSGTTGRTIEELMALAAQYAPQGPDYGAVRQQLMSDTEALNAQLQAMYSAAADRAGENVSRLGDIYGGAQAGIGQAYDTGTGNIEDAYASAQQQAADQLARLGIEAAAPNVINPMALSQAETVSGLEAGRSAGLSAANRYGATAQDFGSQMAQVLQQEGLGYNQALLAALQGRLGNLSMREAEAKAQYNPMESALQYLQLEQGLNPQAPGIDQDFELKRDQANVNNYWRAYDAERQLNPNLPPDELHQRVRDYIITGAMGEDAYNWVMQGNAPVTAPN
jgi:hypothetical protein